MNVLVCRVTAVEDHPNADRLSLITINSDAVVAMKEDGQHRFEVGELAVYVPENSIVPHDVLKERGYWDTEKERGLLAGSQRNRVKMQRFAGIESRALIWKVVPSSLDPDTGFVRRGDSAQRDVRQGDDVGDFFGIEEYVPA